jgi:hypothetical protein
MRALIPSCLLLALLAGCTGGPNPNVVQTDPKTGQPVESPGTAAAMLKAFPDVPIPADHKLDLEHSVIFTAPTQAMGKLVTEGGGSVDTVYHFYAQQMPAQGYKLVNAFQSSTSSLYFTKPGRFVAIIIESAGRSSSRVSMNIGPE